MDVNAVMAAFRSHLIAAELVRRPSEATPAGAPPMFIRPIDGAPSPLDPREGTERDDELILTLMHSSDVAPATAFDAYNSGRAVFDVRFRSANNEASRRATALSAAITLALINPATNYGYGFMLGGLWVLEVNLAGGGPISSSSSTGFDDVVKYLVEAPRS